VEWKLVGGDVIKKEVDLTKTLTPRGRGGLLPDIKDDVVSARFEKEEWWMLRS
jgi:hypothetical protein